MFPLTKITHEDRDKVFKKLQDLRFKKNETLSLSSAGNKVSNYYFQLLRAKTKVGKWSHYSAWNDPEQRQKIYASDKSLHRKKPHIIGTISGLRAAMRMRYGSINQFKPLVAVYIYQKFKPSRVLDTSAGWGDRLIAAMSQNIDYIGIDSNKKLIPAYRKMVNDFKSETESEIELIFKKSENVDYSKLKPYDMIFTSPPYFSLEKYEGMTKYKNNEEFINDYFLPTVEKAYKYLKRGGHMVFNMPKEMYVVLKKNYGVGRKIKMPINNRFNDGTKIYNADCKNIQGLHPNTQAEELPTIFQIKKK